MSPEEQLSHAVELSRIASELEEAEVAALQEDARPEVLGAAGQEHNLHALQAQYDQLEAADVNAMSPEEQMSHAVEVSRIASELEEAQVAALQEDAQSEVLGAAGQEHNLHALQAQYDQLLAADVDAMAPEEQVCHTV